MQAQNRSLSARLITFNIAVTSKGQLVIKKMQFPELDKLCVCMCVCVFVCVCVCVCVYVCVSVCI